MKHVFIINPAAGKKDSTQKIYDMAERLRRHHGQEVECILTKRQGHATEIARQLCESGEDLRFYACGGDGTINEVANGVLGYDNAAMTCIPVGTGNDFLKNFGPDAPLFSDAENLWDGPEFPIDVIDVNGRVALTIACAGLDARVARDVHKYGESPLLTGKGSYVAALIVNFLFRSISSRWTVELDGVAAEDDYAVITVCNGRFYGGGFMPVAEARMDDGVLNTLIVKKVSRPMFLRFVGPYSKGEYAKFPQLATCYTAKTIRIRSDKPDIVTCLDGECVASDDVTIRLSDKQLNFFGPLGCSCNSNARGDATAREQELAQV
jgi:YegS/Rv2252/BmrU family lipid kinase